VPPIKSLPAQLPVAMNRVLTTTVVLLIASAGASAAQVELSMYSGLYFPTSRVGADWRGEWGGVDCIVQWRHENAAALGARLTVWLTDLVGVQGAAVYSPSNLKRRRLGSCATALLGRVEEVDASVISVTARTILRFGAPSRRVGFHVLGGLGFVSRVGEAYDDVEGSTDPAIVLGAGLRVKVGPGVFFRFDAEDYLSEASLKIVRPGTAAPLGSHVQHDLVFSQALVLRL